MIIYYKFYRWNLILKFLKTLTLLLALTSLTYAIESSKVKVLVYNNQKEDLILTDKNTDQTWDLPQSSETIVTLSDTTTIEQEQSEEESKEQDSENKTSTTQTIIKEFPHTVSINFKKCNDTEIDSNTIVQIFKKNGNNYCQFTTYY